MDPKLIAAVDAARLGMIAELLALIPESCERGIQAAEAGEISGLRTCLHEIVATFRAACEAAGELGTEGTESTYE